MNECGVKGEMLAREYLSSKGYEIVECNYSCRFGEIDLIVRKNGYTVFTEVKSRLGLKFGTPADAVNSEKRKKYIKTANFYLLTHHLLDTDVRFDVIEVFADQVNHIENAFWAN